METAIHLETPPTALDPRRWWTLGVVAIAIIVIGVDNTILNVALPTIQAQLHASGAQLQWIVDAYTIVFAGLLLTAGSIGDRFGRRLALTFGLVWFAVFSAAAGLTHSPNALIAARALMGVGGAFIFPTTLSIITNTFTDAKERARAIGIWAGLSGVGIALGPPLGGLLVEHIGWESVFFINLPICLIAAVGARLFVSNSRDPHKTPLDPIGAVTSIFGLGALLYGVIEAPVEGWTSPQVLAGFAIGAVLLAVFAMWESHTDHPMLDVKFFKNPRFSAASATITITYFALFASTFLLTLYFQFILGYSPVKSGAMLTPVAIGLMIAAPLAPRWVERIGTKNVVLVGLTLVGLGMICYGSDTIMSSFALGLVVRFFYGCGMGLIATPVTESIMGSLPRSRAGVGSAINDTTRQTGGAVGVAVLGSVFAMHYHSAIGDLSFLPESTRDAARDSIGGSMQVASKLPGPVGAQLHDVARDAFLSSMRITYAIAALFVGAAMFVAWRFLPAHAATQDEIDAADARFIATEDAVA